MTSSIDLFEDSLFRVSLAKQTYLSLYSNQDLKNMTKDLSDLNN